MHETASIAVVDFGGQYAHLIARRFRNLGFFAEIIMPDADPRDLVNVKGLVLSGGPSSVYADNAPSCNPALLDMDVPILGLCYGHQLLMQHMGGKVARAGKSEFGYATLSKVADCPLWEGVGFPTQVWMSHNDEVSELPAGCVVTGSTVDCKKAAVMHVEKKRFSLQFHAEVRDTVEGLTMLKNYARFCGMPENWDSEKMMQAIRDYVLQRAADKKVLLFLSGGVDSSVTFALLNTILGKERVLGLYIDNGFMRKNETEAIEKRYRAAGYDNFMVEDGSAVFLQAVSGIIDPQEKRRRVGEAFLTVRDQVVKRLKLVDNEWLLAQGTLYPDIIESGGSTHADVIKTHHNRVAGIEDLIKKGLIIEPLRDLYKDEVRIMGRKVGLTEELIGRHPFPGPGLSINVLCSNGHLDDKDEYIASMKELAGCDLTPLLGNIKYQTSVLPVKSVGVQGDFRTYHYPALLSLGTDLPSWDVLEKVASYITNTVRSVNRTVLQLYETKSAPLALQPAYCEKERLDLLREVDAVVLQLLKDESWYNRIFQHLTIILPYATSREHASFVLRPVVSEDVMTARFAPLEMKLVERMVEKICKFSFVDAIYYDISNKPPATFGWE